MDTALIIGPGAVGLAAAAALQKRGFAPGFIGRSGPTAISAAFDSGGGEQPLVFRAPADWRQASLVFIAVKAFDLKAALAWTRELKPGVVVVPFSNGAVAAEVQTAARARPELVWRLGFCTIGITAFGERRYAVKSRTGELAFGPLLPAEAQPSPAEARLVDQRPGASPFRWHAGIVWLHRRKWLFNTVINSLAAARRLPRNGDILGDLAMLSAVFNEAWMLGRAQWGDWPQPRDEVYRSLLALVEATSGNENSMARDVRLGRRTESAWLAGLAKDAKLYPLLVDLHKKLELGAV